MQIKLNKTQKYSLNSGISFKCTSAVVLVSGGDYSWSRLGEPPRINLLTRCPSEAREPGRFGKWNWKIGTGRAKANAKMQLLPRKSHRLQVSGLSCCCGRIAKLLEIIIEFFLSYRLPSGVCHKC